MCLLAEAAGLVPYAAALLVAGQEPKTTNRMVSELNISDFKDLYEIISIKHFV